MHTTKLDLVLINPASRTQVYQSLGTRLAAVENPVWAGLMASFCRRKGLPVEITAEFENWRRIRDSDGDEGWVYQSMLSGKRMALVAPWRKQDAVPMYSGPSTTSNLVAMVKAGVVATLEDCTGEWCSLSASGYEGWIAQPMIWGAYPGERVEK